MIHWYKFNHNTVTIVVHVTLSVSWP